MPYKITLDNQTKERLLEQLEVMIKMGLKIEPERLTDSQLFVLVEEQVTFMGSYQQVVKNWNNGNIIKNNLFFKNWEVK